MSNNPIVINNTDGMSTHANDLAANVGKTALAYNVSFGREGRPETRRGFKNYSTNLPDAQPLQLLASAAQDQAYLHIDNGLWYFDGANWLRKKGAFGATPGEILGMTYLNGHLYCSSLGFVIVDIDLATGARTILAGRYGASGHVDGTGDAARFLLPGGMTNDGTSLYVADTANSAIRKVTLAGVVTTPVGSVGVAKSHTDGTGNAAEFDNPQGLCYDGAGNLYIADTQNNCIRKVVIATGVVTTPYGVAAPATTKAHTDGTGNAARFGEPYDIATDGTNLYVAEYYNNCIRKIVIATGVVTTLAGIADPDRTAGSADGTGNAARFSRPTGIEYDGTDLYVLDSSNNAIRKVTLAGVVTTVFNASPGTDDNLVTSGGSAYQMAYDGTNLFGADRYSLKKFYIGTGYVSAVDGDNTNRSSSSGLSLATGIFTGPD